MSKKYMQYLLREKKSLFLILTVINVLLCLPSMLSHTGSQAFANVLVTLSMYTWLLALVLGPVFFAYVHSRKAGDRMFALPVGRKQMLVSTLVTVDLGILVPYIFLTVLMSLLAFTGYLHGSLPLATILLNTVINVIGVITLTAFISSLYLIANSVFDGVVTIVGYLLIPAFMSLALLLFQTMTVAGGFTPISFKAGNLSLLTVLYKMMDYLLDREFCTWQMYVPFVLCVIGHLAVSVYLLHKNFVCRSTERAEHISDHFLSYRFLLLVYSVLLTFMVSVFFFSYVETEDFFTPVILYILIFICYTVVSFIYRRKITFSFKSVLLFAVVIILSIGFNFLAMRTECFGLARAYHADDLPVRYFYSCAGTDPEIKALLADNGIEADAYAVTFEVTVMDKEDDEDVQTVMENCRSKAITNYYHDTENEAYLGVSEGYRETGEGDLSMVYEDEDYSYGEAPLLSLDELKAICCKTEVSLEAVFETGTDTLYQTVSLNDLLN